MKACLFLFCAAVLVITGCSGLVPNPMSNGKIVSPGYLSQFSGGGSISTLWYLGSDRKYHYFEHYGKVSTPYRVRRQDLQIPDEFPYKSRKPVFIGNAPFWKND